MTKTRQWVVFTAVAVVVVLAAGWFVLVKPQRSHAADLRSQTVTQQQQNQILQSQIAALENEQKNLPEQQALLQKFATRVPDNPSEPTMIRQLSAAAAGAGVDIVSMTPSPATAVLPAGLTSTTSTTPTAGASAQLMQLPIALDITGSFPNVESFFQSLEKLPRALMVTGWALCPEQAPDTGSSTVSGGAVCTAPTVPTAKQPLPSGTLGGTLSAVVYYAPPAGTGTGTTTTSSTTGTAAATPAATAPATPPAS